MMKLLRVLPLVAGAALLVHRFGPEMGKVCECIFDKLPDDFPPKWMYLNITAIREQNERIIALLEEHIEDSA
jgi:hypothetical protein